MPTKRRRAAKGTDSRHKAFGPSLSLITGKAPLASAQKFVKSLLTGKKKPAKRRRK